MPNHETTPVIDPNANSASVIHTSSLGYCVQKAAHPKLV